MLLKMVSGFVWLGSGRVNGFRDLLRAEGGAGGAGETHVGIGMRVVGGEDAQEEKGCW
jgi:hypothetical protein